MALSKSALKAKFVTGVIPTQTDFANLIDGMLSMPLGGGTGDTTINFGKGDSFDRIFVNAFRYFYGIGESFFLIGSYDETESTNIISVIIKFTDDSFVGGDWNITYHILDKSDRRSLYENVGGINEADEESIYNWIRSANLPYYNIENKFNNNPSPRTIVINNSTYICWPVKQNSEWYVGIVWEMKVDMGGSNSLYRYYPTGNSQTKWNVSDQQVVDDLKTKWNKANTPI